MIDVNLHTHTYRCQHAQGDVRDYCEEAIRSGFRTLGISDHSPFLYGEYSSTRMSYDQLSEYRKAIEVAVDEYAKQGPFDFTLLAGLEIDYLPQYGVDYYRKTFLEEEKFDYLIGGVHYITEKDGSRMSMVLDDPRFISRYVEQTVELLQTGLIDYLVHPDFIGWAFSEWTPFIASKMEEIIVAAVALDIPLEINANGYRKGESSIGSVFRHQYPLLPFWELVAHHGAKVVIGSDAHTPQSLADGNWHKSLELAKTLGFTPCNHAIAEKILMQRRSRWVPSKFY